MKKNLIAVAIAAVLATPAAALADTTLYGRAHLSLDSLDDGADSAIYLSNNLSVLGVKGSEALGNGTNVLYQLEGLVEWDGGGSWGASSITYLGLEGGFGTFLAGRLPASEQWLYDADLFGNAQIGEVANLMPILAGQADNALHYVLPAMGGLGVALTYVPDENSGAGGDLWGARVTYAGGPLFLGLTHFAADASPDMSETALTAGYAFDGFKLVAAYATHDDTGADHNAWTLGGSVAIGGGSAKLQYTSADKIEGVANSSASMWAIGYDFPLSKRTTAYAAYAAVNNGSAAAYGMSGYDHGDVVVPALGDDPDGFSFGLIHSF